MKFLLSLVFLASSSVALGSSFECKGQRIQYLVKSKDYGMPPRPGSLDRVVTVILDGKVLEKLEYFIGEGAYHRPRFSFSSALNIRDHKRSGQGTGILIETYTADGILKPTKGSNGRLPGGVSSINEVVFCENIKMLVP